MTFNNAGYLLQKHSFRAIQYDYETLINYGDGYCLVCLSDFQLAWLLSNTEYMGWKNRWDNFNGTTQELQDMQSELEYALMSCIDLKPYQITYTYNQAVKEQLQTFNDDYTGTPSSVNADCPDDFFNGDDSQARNNALCTACKIYVYSYVANWVTQAEIILGVTIAVAFLASISIVGGVIAGTLLAGLALITQVALDAMRDEDAVNDVVCCMVDAMEGTVINQANFEASLDACGFAGGSNASIVRDIIASDLVQFDNLLSFYNTLGDSFVLAEAGVFDCPCDFDWEHTFDFIVDNTAQGWSPYVSRAVLTPTGWSSQLPTDEFVQMMISFPSTQITEVEFTGTGLFTGACPSVDALRFPDVFGADGMFVNQGGDYNINVTSTGMWISACTTNTVPRLEKIVVRGFGFDPF